jgi:hypothetical protein
VAEVANHVFHYLQQLETFRPEWEKANMDLQEVDKAISTLVTLAQQNSSPGANLNVNLKGYNHNTISMSSVPMLTIPFPPAPG